jgi:hypothetical protein
MNDAARRRAELVERMDSDREAVAEAFGVVRKRLKIAETLVSTVQRAGQHRVLSGVLAVAAIVAPMAARTWLKRTAWFLPLAIAALRFLRTRDDRAEPEQAD